MTNLKMTKQYSLPLLRQNWHWMTTNIDYFINVGHKTPYVAMSLQYFNHLFGLFFFSINILQNWSKNYLKKKREPKTYDWHNKNALFSDSVHVWV